MYEYIKELLNENLEEQDEEFNSTGKLVMDALTSKDGKILYKMGAVEEGAITHKDDEDKAIANKDYLSLNFKLRTKTNRGIVLSKLLVESEGVASWEVDQDFTLAKDSLLYGPEIEKNDTLKANLADALRISIINNDENASEDTTVFEKDGNGDTNTTGGLAKDSEGNYVGGFEYYAKKTGRPDLKPASDFETAINLLTTKYFGDLSDVKYTNDNKESDAYFILDLTINIWFEGYDNEAFDAVLDQLVSIAFEFELEKIEP